MFNKLYAGILYEYQNVLKLNYRDNGIFQNSITYGKSPYEISGPGASIGFDNRNGTFWPTKGIYLFSQTTLFNRVFASDFDVVKTLVDFRTFNSLRKNIVLASQAYVYFTSGQIPIRDYAALGGSNNLRGFYQGRFRDNNMYSLISECRWNFYKRLSACFFGGIGSVFSTEDQITVQNVKYTYGGGLRYALLKKERLNLRLDYGFSSRYDSGIYFTVGECF